MAGIEILLMNRRGRRVECRPSRVEVIEEVKNADVVRFGPFELSLETGQLRKNGVRIRLSGQPIQVLTLLLATPGKLVTREHLQECSLEREYLW